MCVYGHGVVRGIFEEVKGPELVGFDVWLPMMGGDTEKTAGQAAAAFSDDRVSQSWDADRRLAKEAAVATGMKKTPWDAYLLYAPGIRWEDGKLPEPSFWMAQLPSGWGVEPSRLLNPGRFAEEVYRLLGKNDGREPADRWMQLHSRAVLEVRKKGEGFQQFMEQVESPRSEAGCEDSCAL